MRDTINKIDIARSCDGTGEVLLFIVGSLIERNNLRSGSTIVRTMRRAAV